MNHTEEGGHLSCAGSNVEAEGPRHDQVWGGDQREWPIDNDGGAQTPAEQGQGGGCGDSHARPCVRRQRGPGPPGGTPACVSQAVARAQESCVLQAQAETERVLGVRREAAECACPAVTLRGDTCAVERGALGAGGTHGWARSPGGIMCLPQGRS